MGWGIEESQIFLLGLALKLIQIKLGLILKFMPTLNECKKGRKELRLGIKPIQVTSQGLELENRSGDKFMLYRIFFLLLIIIFAVPPKTMRDPLL